MLYVCNKNFVHCNILHIPATPQTQGQFSQSIFFSQSYTHCFKCTFTEKYTNFRSKYAVNFKKNFTYNLIFKGGKNKIYSIYKFFFIKNICNTLLDKINFLKYLKSHFPNFEKKKKNRALTRY